MLGKTTRVVLFIILASVGNILLMGTIFIILMSLYLSFLAPLFPVGVNTTLGLVLFCASVVLTYIVYQQVLKKFGKKLKLDTLVSKKK